MKYQRVTTDKRRKIDLDLIGLKFGKLTVAGISDKRSNGDTGRTLYVCRCDCGREMDLSARKLTPKDPRSRKTHCGCSPRAGEKHVKVDRYENSHKVMSNYISGANRRGIEWGLSVDETLKLFNLNCYYCGKQPSNTYSGIKRAVPFLYNGIDRLDSKKGYFLDNCVSCCSRCNYIKSDIHVDEFLKFIKEVYEHRIKK